MILKVTSLLKGHKKKKKKKRTSRIKITLSSLSSLMLHLFERKIFYKKYFYYFSIFGASENNGQ
jgi:hypothetical protein